MIGFHASKKLSDLLGDNTRELNRFCAFTGRWCFLPAVPCLPLGNWIIPAKPMQELAMGIRRVSRVLWALHVTFQEVIDGSSNPQLVLCP